MGDLGTEIGEATEGVVKWDDNTNDTIHGVGLQEGGKITGTSLVTNSTIGSVKIENGAVTTTGNAQSSIGGVKFQSGKMTAPESITVGSVKGNQTIIDGGSIASKYINSNSGNIGDVAIQNGTVDGVDVSELDANAVKWDPGTKNTIHGVQLAGDGAISAASDRFSVDRNGNIAAQTYGGQGEPHYYFNMNQDDGISFGHSDGASVTVGENGTTFTYGGQSTIINGNNITTFGANGVTDGKIDGQISTGHVYASKDMYIGGNEDANKVATMGDLGTEIGEATEGVVKWDDENQDSIHGVGLENGKVTADSASIGNILMKEDRILINGTTSLSKDGLVMNDGNGNAVYLGGGQLMVSGNIQAGSGTIGNVEIANGLVDGVDVSELAGNVSALDQNAVKWDDENHNSINGVGLADGNVTADKVTTGELDVNGHADISGNLNVGGSLTVGGETVATGADVTDIKKQIGVNEDGSYKTIENGANDVITGINKNAAAIGDVTALKGTNANGEKYTNLTDAVNGNYDRIEQNTTAIAQNSQAINSLGHRVSDLGDEIDSVGAISAALAGLHPLDYDGTGSKFQISAAMGTYDGTQAAAIGGFYHFNRDVMLSLGGATSFEGDKKTAANIGVTFRVGEGASGKTVSNDILTRLEAMDQKIAALEQENKELKNVLGAIDTSLSKEFPDVPANHWAYEAVTKLAGNDVVDGYPDGEFHGDRTMTRYEMAEIIYKAMNRGAKVDQKLVEEFKPEMEQVAANETAQAQSTPAQEAPAQDAQ